MNSEGAGGTAVTLFQPKGIQGGKAPLETPQIDPQGRFVYPLHKPTVWCGLGVLRPLEPLPRTPAEKSFILKMRPFHSAAVWQHYGALGRSEPPP